MPELATPTPTKIFWNDGEILMLKKGDLCKVTNANNTAVFVGDIGEYQRMENWVEGGEVAILLFELVEGGPRYEQGLFVDQFEVVTKRTK